MPASKLLWPSFSRGEGCFFGALRLLVVVFRAAGLLRVLLLVLLAALTVRVPLDLPLLLPLAIAQMFLWAL